MKNYSNNITIIDIPGPVSINDNYVELGRDIIVKPGVIAIEDANLPGYLGIFNTRQEAVDYIERMSEDGCGFYFLPNSSEKEFEDAVKFATELLSIEEFMKEEMEELDEYELLQDEFDTRR